MAPSPSPEASISCCSSPAGIDLPARIGATRCGRRASSYARALCCGVAMLLGLHAGAAYAQLSPEFPGGVEPMVGQDGKDVIWVPTPQILVDRMLDLAKVTPQDRVIDLGSGDGRTVIAAARRGATALGIEFNVAMVELSRRKAQGEGVAERARFVQGDLFAADLSGASVITMFLLPAINMRLRPTLLALVPGTRIVSNTFRMEDWEPDASSTVPLNGECSGCTAHLWIVPARVAGTHATPHGTLVLEQTFQKLTGTLASAGRTMPVQGKVSGTQVVVAVDGRELRGDVEAGRIVWSPNLR